MRAALPLALTHPYGVASDGRSMLLYRGIVHWQSQHVARELPDSLVYLDLMPTPHLLVDGLLPAAQAFGDWFSPHHRVTLPALARVPPAPAQRIPAPREGEGSVTQRAPLRGIRVGVRRRTRSVRFVVLNFLPIVGAPVRYEDGSMQSGRVRFTADGWRVTLDEVHPRLDVFNNLRSDGGITSTHVGELARTAGEDFLPADALEILECLHYTLWFTRGASCAALLPIGFDRRDNAIWAEWREAWVESYTTPINWLDHLRGDAQLSDLFPCFLGAWRNPLYNSAIRIALRNYLDANAANPIESSIALAQLALESLAYAHLVAASSDPAAFGRRIPAHVTLRRLLELLHIPRRFPNPASSLRSARPAGWNDTWDGPSAVTWLRNYAMHGERALPGPSWRNYWEGWQLSCWYVEMVILALCGYRGTYVSRLHMDSLRNTVHRVPWARH